MSERIIIFDTTLRDGEQAAGVALTPEEKMQIARQLERLGVDVIEAGFPWSSPGDAEAVAGIAQEVRRPVICALSFAQPQAVDAAWEAIKKAARPRIHVFLSSSDIHLYYQLKKSRDEILEIAGRMVQRAKQYVEDVEFSPMDATRTDPSFLYQVLKVAIEAGATVVNIPDTVGYAIPKQFCQIIRDIFANVPNINKAMVSVHCHDDLGLAVANSISALDCGVRQVECTVNGIGERAGNASLEEIVMAIKIRQDVLPYHTNIDTTQLYRTSRLVSELTGIPVQPNKAIVGANAFRHQSGIHQDGILKAKITYEIIDPETVGAPGTVLSLGKLSGRHALKRHLEELGYSLNDDELSRFFVAFKALADRKKEVTDRDLEALLSQEFRAASEALRLAQVHVMCGEPGLPTALVEIRTPEGEPLVGVATGAGPVDASFKAISEALKQNFNLVDFSIRSVTGGPDALNEVMVKIEKGGRTFIGRGASTDIIVASVRAYLNAINKLFRTSKEGA